jgi:acetyltransferase
MLALGLMEYPADLAREHRLADGREVLIRPVRPEDAREETAFLTHLSPLARRLRFQRWGGEVDKLVRFHTRIDYETHMGFVGEAQGRIVGEAQYVANPGGRSCELGIVVAEDWRHSGVAQLLLQALIDAARSRGFESLEGLVMRENGEMLGFVRPFGFRVETVPEDRETVRISLTL